MKIIKIFFGKKRVKSFLWRTGMMAVAGFLTLIASSLGDFGLTGDFAVVLGLILGEVSKALNSKAK